MKQVSKRFVCWFWLTAFGLSGLVAAAPVWAHDGSPAILMVPFQAAPGTAVEIQGINLLTDTAVEVMMVGDGREIPLGSAVCDGHGDFVQSFTLPANMTTAVYELQAIDTSIAGTSQVLAASPVRIDPVPAAPHTYLPPLETTQTRSSAEPLMALLIFLSGVCFLIVIWRWWRQSKQTELNR